MSCIAAVVAAGWAADPVRHAVIAVAIDWARIGRSDPVPEPVLIDLTMPRLREAHPELDVTEDAVRVAITAARTPPQGSGRASALRTHYPDNGIRTYRPFDYLVAADDGQDGHTPQPIPDSFWRKATRDTNSDILAEVGATAYLRKNFSTANTLWREAANVGHVEAMHYIGILLLERGDGAAAEHWWRESADAGHPGAMRDLGRLLLIKRRGDHTEGQVWLRKAADAGCRG
ncbi:TPR repeat protein [Nocardia sp. GAS34]|uniref:tetratricopeptide repeat protein n=1 Tax=unclassified Nocardia TaxID=2637762 RepID=UPI003D19BE90